MFLFEDVPFILIKLEISPLFSLYTSFLLLVDVNVLK
jgi:hypothetical protein